MEKSLVQVLILPDVIQVNFSIIACIDTLIHVQRHMKKLRLFPIAALVLAFTLLHVMKIKKITGKIMETMQEHISTALKELRLHKDAGVCM